MQKTIDETRLLWYLCDLYITHKVGQAQILFFFNHGIQNTNQPCFNTVHFAVFFILAISWISIFIHILLNQMDKDTDEKNIPDFIDLEKAVKDKVNACIQYGGIEEL